MLFRTTALLSLAASAFAAPATVNTRETRAAAGVGTAVSVLKVQNYSDFQVSDGVAGNALAEVKAKFPVSLVAPTGHPSQRHILNSRR